MRKEHPVKWQKLKEINSKKTYWEWMDEHGSDIHHGNKRDDNDYLLREHARNIQADSNNNQIKFLKDIGAIELRKAVEKLTLRQQQVIKGILKQMSLTDIAHKYKIAYQTVYTVQLQAIKALGKHLTHLKENGVVDALGRDKKC